MHDALLRVLTAEKIWVSVINTKAGKKLFLIVSYRLLIFVLNYNILPRKLRSLREYIIDLLIDCLREPRVPFFIQMLLIGVTRCSHIGRI